MLRDCLNAAVASIALGVGAILAGAGISGALIAVITFPVWVVTSRGIRSFYTADRLTVLLLSSCVWAPFAIGTVAFGDWLTSPRFFNDGDFTDFYEPDLRSKRFEDPGGDCFTGATDTDPRTGNSVWAGVVDGKARFTPRVDYQPLFERSSVVPVLMFVDYSGNVVWTQSLSGPPEYRLLARDAACRAKFAPSFIDGPPVLIQGIMTFQFNAKKRASPRVR